MNGYNMTLHAVELLRLGVTISQHVYHYCKFLLREPQTNVQAARWSIIIYLKCLTKKHRFCTRFIAQMKERSDLTPLLRKNTHICNERAQ
jgi:hypothetical protein